MVLGELWILNGSIHNLLQATIRCISLCIRMWLRISVFNLMRVPAARWQWEWPRK